MLPVHNLIGNSEETEALPAVAEQVVALDQPIHCPLHASAGIVVVHLLPHPVENGVGGAFDRSVERLGQEAQRP